MLKLPERCPSWTLQDSRNSLLYLNLTLFGAGTSYSQLHAPGCRHRRVETGSDPEQIEEHFPWVHRVVALLKRWLLETHQGAVRKRHRDYCLDEFTIGFDRQTSRSRGRLFYGLSQQAVVAAPAPASALVAPS